MKAAILEAPGQPFLVEEVDLLPPRAGEVRVRIAASGVCRSDLHVQTGSTPHPVPVVCGHEGAGVVEEVGEGVTRIRPGDHAVLSWAPHCGSCFYCRSGLPCQCEAFLEPIWAGTMADGTTRLRWRGAPAYHYTSLATFAESAVVPESCCIPIRKDVPFEAAALVGCAVTTGFCAAVHRGGIERGASVAVFGCGGVGASVIQGAAHQGAGRIVAVDVTAAKLSGARSFGATDVVDASRTDPVEAIRALTEGRGADTTFEAIGRPETMAQAIEAARRGGRIVLVGLGGHEETIPVGAGTFTRSDKILTAAYYGASSPHRDMPWILDLYAEGKVRLDEMVSARRPLAEINLAFEDLRAGDLLRTVLVF